MLKNLIDRWKISRLRPGIIFAAKLAEQQAWKHENVPMLGPERNLIGFSMSLHDRLLRAEEGDKTGLYLDSVTRLPRRRDSNG